MKIQFSLVRKYELTKVIYLHKLFFISTKTSQPTTALNPTQLIGVPMSMIKTNKK